MTSLKTKVLPDLRVIVIPLWKGGIARPTGVMERIVFGISVSEAIGKYLIKNGLPHPRGRLDPTYFHRVRISSRWKILMPKNKRITSNTKRIPPSIPTNFRSTAVRRVE